MAGAMDGIKVLDFGQIVSAPMAAMWLGDQGADVIKVESPAGDPLRSVGPRIGDVSAIFAAVNRGKRSITADTALAGLLGVSDGSLDLASISGALAQLRRLTRAGLGGPLGSGKQWWPTISLVDEVGAILHLLDRPEITGPVNVVGPAPIPQRDLAHMIGQRLRRPTLLPAPSPAMRLVAGEFADDLLASQRAIPSVLLGSGFTFEHGTLSDALTWALELEQPPREEPETPADGSGRSEA